LNNLIDYFIAEDYEFIDKFLGGEHIPGKYYFNRNYYNFHTIRFLWIDSRREKRKRTRIRFEIFGRNLIQYKILKFFEN
jgi:hypothetical protein